MNACLKIKISKHVEIRKLFLWILISLEKKYKFAKQRLLKIVFMEKNQFGITYYLKWKKIASSDDFSGKRLSLITRTALAINTQKLSWLLHFGWQLVKREQYLHYLTHVTSHFITEFHLNVFVTIRTSQDCYQHWHFTAKPATKWIAVWSWGIQE